ncbi:hypothetical protein DERP_001739 [Dermatophagoides pteronyssinus]|uniref:Uncharacterized protein n=1 Tax=Dermatophagoides pteronyssinus TaxID=6956 RepID=A0ABQ8JC20_DERPT|nr:hypothetical protein DERP_001739 [Dermatophagoides pteronyssinus]
MLTLPVPYLMIENYHKQSITLLFRIHATDWIAERIYDYVGGVCELYISSAINIIIMMGVNNDYGGDDDVSEISVFTLSQVNNNGD